MTTFRAWILRAAAVAAIALSAAPAFAQAVNLEGQARIKVSSVNGVRQMVILPPANQSPFWHAAGDVFGDVETGLSFGDDADCFVSLFARVTDPEDDALALTEPSGDWPAGCTPDYEAGEVNGTTTTPGTGTVTVRACEVDTPTNCDDWVVAWTVTPNADPPVLLSAIADKSGTQGVALTKNCGANFSGATSYSIPSAGSAGGLASSTGLSFNTSTCAFTGTPNSNDVGSRSIEVTATNAGGSIMDAFNLSISASPGDTFTISNSATPAAYSFNCATTSGCGPGDTIVIGAGVHANRTITFSNMIGNATNWITVRNDTAAGSRATIRTPSGRPRAGFKCQNCAYVKFTGFGGWSGQAAGRCGMTETPNGILDNGEVAIDSYEGQGCGIYFDGATNGPAQDMVLLQGWPRSPVIVEGMEMSGDWTCTANAQGQCSPADTNYTEAHGVNFNDKSVCENDPGVTTINGNQVRHNYIHNFNDTAMYLGANVGGCGGQVSEPTLVNLLIEYNVWDTIGEGGAKIKHVEGNDPTAAIIRYNWGRNGGGSTEATATGHNSLLFSCYEASCTVYGNRFEVTRNDTKTGSGLVCGIQHRPTSWGTQVCHFYGNTIIGTSGGGITSSRSTCTAKASGSCNASNDAPTAQMDFRVEYNTIVDAGQQSGNCVSAPSAVGAGYVRQNVCAGETAITGSNLTISGNSTGTVAFFEFQNSGSKDYRLKSTSPARNAGPASGCPTVDMILVTRPKGGLCDRGSYEFNE